MELVSPYFVPGTRGTQFFGNLARQGVKIKVLTNSLEATDVAVVHAGYAKRRTPLLRAGVILYEMKRANPSTKRGPKGSSSASSLHAKTFAVDRSSVFIGSFNFDPRSARLNSELSFVIESPAIAHAIADAFAERNPARAYQAPGRSRGAALVEQAEGKEVVHDREPGTTFWQRLGVSVLSLLPIEWLL